jgi:hypothetical protein
MSRAADDLVFSRPACSWRDRAAQVSGWKSILQTRLSTPRVKQMSRLARVALCLAMLWPVSPAWTRDNVVANHSDPDGDALTVIGLSKTTSTRADYQFSGGFITITAKSSKGGDTLTYTVSDGRGGTANATLSIYVTF